VVVESTGGYERRLVAVLPHGAPPHPDRRCVK
jgi:hypothetical protein